MKTARPRPGARPRLSKAAPAKGRFRGHRPTTGPQPTTSLDQFARRAATDATTRRAAVVEVGIGDSRYETLFARTRYLSVVAPKHSAPDRLPVESGMFGVVLCLEVVAETSEPEDVLAELNRALHADGRLFLSTPLVVSPWPTAMRGQRHQLGLNYLLQASGFELEDLQALRNTASYAVTARKSPPASRAIATRGYL